jgi:hypothetical protein
MPPATPIMSESTEKTFEQAAAFQKIWLETFNKMAQTGLSFTPDAAPPEFLRQMRTGIFAALAKSWEEFMRTPQFLESMKAMMENAIAFRKMSADMLTQVQHSVQGTARSDINDLMQALHHLETRILDRVEDVSKRLEKLEKKGSPAPRNGATKTPRHRVSTPVRKRTKNKLPEK